MLLYYTALLTPETSLWAKQQFPKGSCQDELVVMSGAHTEEGTSTRDHSTGSSKVFIKSGREYVFESHLILHPNVLWEHFLGQRAYTRFAAVQGGRRARNVFVLSSWPGGTKARIWSKSLHLGETVPSPLVWVRLGSHLDMHPQASSCFSGSFYESRIHEEWVTAW